MLQPGSRSGPYEVAAPIGAGGMGQVWRARDTRLERSVAIKFLPAEFAANTQLRVRFEREARTISQLNHPNVCTLFDVGQHEGNDFLVMELIEGETLADRLLRGPLPIGDVLRHGVEIASALDAAHRQGIVHRDLKPGNVMLTRSGAKLLDFGLAKSGPLLVSSPGLSNLLDSPTEHRPLTEQGTLLGTFQYMAPEQLEGLEADARTDIFAFGALLYEMATGQRAFQGKNRTSLIAAIVSSVPRPVGEVVPLTPPALDHVIRKCLAKDPDDRWQSIHDVGDQLRWIGEAGSKAGEPAPLVAKRKSRLRTAWAMVAVSAVLGAAATLAVIAGLRQSPRVVRTSILPSEKTRFSSDNGAMALSPDGRLLAFLASDENGKRKLWLRPLDAGEAQPLAGTEDASHPFWSPNSRTVAFFAAGKLRRVDADGGPPQVICDAPGGRGGTWSADGVILFTPTPTSPLFRVASTGGAPVAVTSLDAKRQEASHRLPEFLPDGKHFLFLIEGGQSAGGFELWGGSLDAPERKLIVETPSSARYARSGQLLFVRDRTLVAQPFDAENLRLEGEAVPLVDNITRTQRYDTVFSISENGLLVFQSGPASTKSQLVLVDREGHDAALVGKPAEYTAVALSHDGKRVAASIVDTGTYKSDIWVLDILRGTSTRITFDEKNDSLPIWSPDDRYIYFYSDRQGKGDVFRKASAGTGTDELVWTDAPMTQLISLTGDGSTAALMTNNVATTGWDVSLLSLADRKVRPLLATPFMELFPSISRDGRWLLYHSNETGRAEVYVQRLDGDGGKWQVSTDGGSRGRWSRDGKAIIFIAPDFKFMIADVTLEPSFSVSVPRVWMTPGMKQVGGAQYDVSSDGSRVLVNRALEEPTVTPFTLVQNWPASLKK
jgi:Tol biopolymer transport system component